MAVTVAYSDGSALEFAAALEKLRGDKELVLATVKMRKYALQYASKELWGDKDIVISALLLVSLSMKDDQRELAEMINSFVWQYTLVNLSGVCTLN